MQREQGVLFVVGLVALMSFALAGCTVAPSEQAPKETDAGVNQVNVRKPGTVGEVLLAEEQVIRTAFLDDMNIMDPALVTDDITFCVLNNTMEGLTRIQPDGSVEEGMATHWEVTDDGLQYTFTLRDARWSDGEPVTARDFVFAWERVMNPDTAAQYAYIMTDYVEKVTAPDEKTLEVRLKVPVPYFLHLTAFPTYFPVREDLLKEYGDEYGTIPEKVAFNGPFVVSRWDRESMIHLMKNESYWDSDVVKLKEVHFAIVRDTSATVQMYEAGELDLVEQVPVQQLQKYQGSPELVLRSEATTDYLVFNTKSESVPALANKNVRRALAVALDRKRYLQQVEKQFLPAYGFVPPTVSGAGAGETFRSGNGEAFQEYTDMYTGQTFNMSVWFEDNQKEVAQRLLMEGLRESGEERLQFTLLIEDTPRAKRLGRTFQQMWRENLGVEVQLEPVDFQTRLKRLHNKDYEVANVLWSADYNDPMTFLGIFVTSSAFNDPQWSNEQYDQLIAEAKSTNDQEVRMQNFLAAEKILMDEMPVAPVYYRLSYSLQKQNVKDVAYYVAGADQSFKWAYVMQ